MSPETALRETLPALNVAAEGLIETRKEAFFEKLRTAKGFSRGYGYAVGRFDSTHLLVSNIPKERYLGLMTLHFYSPKSRRLVFILFVLISLVFSGTAFGKKKITRAVVPALRKTGMHLPESA